MHLGPIRLTGFLLCAFLTVAFAQESETTRAGEIEAARRAKSQTLTPEKQSEIELKVEKYLDEGWVSAVLGARPGFGLQFGGLVPGAGFSMGPKYTRPDLFGERMKFSISAVGSLKQFYSVDTVLSFPRIAGDRFDVEARAGHSDSPQLRYFGPGPESQRWGRTNYRREDTYGSVRIGWRPDRRHWLVGYRFQALRLNVGPGTSDESLSTDKVYGPNQAPGIDRQPEYFIAGPVLLADYRDRPGDPHRGTALQFHADQYSDRTLGQYSFWFYDVKAEHYIPFFNEKRVIALLARTQLTDTDGANIVPFYMRPVLGGTHTLRGFSQYRFNDNNYLLFSSEYRWEVAPALDMAVFADAGNVFPRPGLIGFRNMEYSGGLGFRIKTRSAVALRIDTAVSREGFRIWFATSNAFSR